MSRPGEPESTRASTGKASAAEAMAPASTTGRRPTRSDSADAAGRTARATQEATVTAVSTCGRVYPSSTA